MKQENLSQAVISSVGVLVYTGIVATIMSSGEKLFGKEDTVFTMVSILMLFTLSAAVVGSLIIAKPIMLFIDGKKKEAVNLLTMTIASLFVLTALVLVAASIV